MNPTKNLKIMVLSHATGTGKTTISNRLLSPLLNAGYFNINNRKDIVTVFISVNLCDKSVIIDVDSTYPVINETFDFMLKVNEASLKTFDYFIIPHVTFADSQKTISTVMELHKLGISKGKIIIVFNMIKKNSDVNKEIMLISSCIPYATINEKFIIDHSEIYGWFEKEETFDFINDDTDFKSLSKDTSRTEDERLDSSKKLIAKMLLNHFNKSLADIFSNSITVSKNDRRKTSNR